VGHIRLGALPRTRKWTQVVALIAAGAGANQVAQATLEAAEDGLKKAATDKGLLESFWLLTQIPFAARTPDFSNSLGQCGLDVPSSPGLVEITTAFVKAVDAVLPNNSGRTDIGEMAQMAAVETISQVIGQRTQSMFGVSSTEVQAAFAQLTTVKNFGSFARAFFGRFTNKCLDYHLSRTLFNHIGEGKRFPGLAQYSDFAEALGKHCHEAAKIVETYAGEWCSKMNWLHGGISRKNTAGFVSYAVTKMIAELKEGAHYHGA
jgi:hypothetical protein